MAWAVLLCLCSCWCRGSRLWSLFLFSLFLSPCFSPKQFSVSLSRFPLSLLFSFFLFSLRIPPLNLSFASLLLQNFAPPLVSFFPFPLPPHIHPLFLLQNFCPPLRSSLSQKNRPPLFSVLSPVFIGSRGRGSPYPVQVQGMVAWELQGMVV